MIKNGILGLGNALFCFTLVLGVFKMDNISSGFFFFVMALLMLTSYTAYDYLRKFFTDEETP